MNNCSVFFLSFIILSCANKKNVNSSFENAEIDKIWKRSKLSKNSWRIQKEVVRDGNYSMQFTLKKGMKEEIGQDGKKTERVELKEKDKYHAKINETHLYKFSFFIPKNFPLLKTRLVIGQWKQIGKNNPVLAQRFVDGIFYLTVSNDNGKKTILKLSKKQSSLLLGKWVDVEYKIKFSHKNGFIHYKVGALTGEYNGSLAFKEDKNRFYFKFGLYRDQIIETMNIYFDSYKHIFL